MDVEKLNEMIADAGGVEAFEKILNELVEYAKKELMNTINKLESFHNTLLEFENKDCDKELIIASWSAYRSEFMMNLARVQTLIEIYPQVTNRSLFENETVQYDEEEFTTKIATSIKIIDTFMSEYSK